MNKQKRIEILTRLREQNPHPTTELNFSSPFELLIAVILSAQATDKGVNKATDKLFPVANTPQAILKLGVDGLMAKYLKIERHWRLWLGLDVKLPTWYSTLHSDIPP